MAAGAAAVDPGLVDALNETLGRCRELFLNQRELWCVRERSDWIAASVRPLHSATPPTKDEMSALAALAFGGWCWREVEQGDRSCLQGTIATAYTEAQADPAVPDRMVPAWAAWRFLQAGGDPADGSPGPTVQARTAFLRAACERFHEIYAAPIKAPENIATDPFYRGVVLNDVERLALNRLPVIEVS
jgi:hypothetical protein